jgi:PleD family two-component response regulator
MNKATGIEHPLNLNKLTLLRSSKTIRVLHLDDDALSLDVTKEFLNNEGYFEVDSASSVKEALRK